MKLHPLSLFSPVPFSQKDYCSSNITAIAVTLSHISMALGLGKGAINRGRKKRRRTVLIEKGEYS